MPRTNRWFNIYRIPSIKFPTPNEIRHQRSIIGHPSIFENKSSQKNKQHSFRETHPIKARTSKSNPAKPKPERSNQNRNTRKQKGTNSAKPRPQLKSPNQRGQHGEIQHLPRPTPQQAAIREPTPGESVRNPACYRQQRRMTNISDRFFGVSFSSVLRFAVYNGFRLLWCPSFCFEDREDGNQRIRGR